ncbi:MAG: tRNA 4-thiouridine(8) synthase ThiI [Alicyclobacillaceae bacterium]|nr:tRNA 4-thiouridine(8) synthase ThiI [Alicyclobacillaceae bacterium]
MFDHIIARYGEIGLKGHNRSEFEKILAANMCRCLAPWPGVKVSRIEGRMLVHLNGTPVEPVRDALERVFGIVSLSPVERVPADLEAIGQAAVRVVNGAELAPGSGHTFKVEAKRADKRFPFPSPDIARRVGAYVLRRLKDWSVDVHQPAVTVFVEVREDGAFVYGTRWPGAGGLPVGSSGRVGLLLSGGIDSPVAGWLAMKRGAEVEAIHFHSYPFTSERALQKVQVLAQILADWGGRVHLHVVHFTDVQTAIRKHCPEALGITVMRRMMFRIAAVIAERRGLLALVTGESLGQVASQTLESLRVINDVIRLPVLRPLIAEDKVDIMRRAREIGTYETSILPYEDCCTLFVPKNPRTRPSLAEAEKAERDLAVEDLVRQAADRTEMQTFHARRGVDAGLNGVS